MYVNENYIPVGPTFYVINVMYMDDFYSTYETKTVVERT